MSGTRVYVGHLDQRTRESDLEKCFKTFGRVREVTLKNGFGFVEFEDYRDADDAVHEMNGKDLMGSRIAVEFTRGLPRGRGGGGGGGGGGGYGGDRGYRGDRGDRGGYRDRGPPRSMQRSPRQYNGPPARTPHRAVIQNLSSSVSWQDLKDFMRQAGEVVFTDVFPKRNEGVVEFASATDLRNALSKLDGKDFNGRKIRLMEEKYHKKDDDRRRSRSSSRSKSRSRSRSRSRRRTRSKSRSRSSSRSRSRSSSRSGGRNKNNARKEKDVDNGKRSASPNGAADDDGSPGNQKEDGKRRKSHSGGDE